MAMIIGLAIQANIANVFSGIILNLENKVKINHMIKFTTASGNDVIATVKDISWRSVELETVENNIMIVPNAAFAEMFITNFSLLGNLPVKKGKPFP